MRAQGGSLEPPRRCLRAGGTVAPRLLQQGWAHLGKRPWQVDCTETALPEAVPSGRHTDSREYLEKNAVGH